MRLALVITTHERPDALAAVLDSVARQRVAPDEIVIADDGSGAATQEVIAAFISRSARPARQVSQPHEGFRVARLRNLAHRRDVPRTTSCSSTATCCCIRSSSPIIGASARPGFYTQGVRVHTDARADRKADRRACARCPRSGRAGLGGLRRLYLLRSPALASLTRSARQSLHRHQVLQPGHLARRPRARQRLQ